MLQKATQSDQFKEQMQGSLLSETKNSSAIKVAKHNHVYTIGDERETVYFIEKGQIKLVMVSEEGKECMLAIHGAGDVFGELCLSVHREFFNAVQYWTEVQRNLRYD